MARDTPPGTTQCGHTEHRAVATPRRPPMDAPSPSAGPPGVVAGCDVAPATTPEGPSITLPCLSSVTLPMTNVIAIDPSRCTMTDFTWAVRPGIVDEGDTHCE